MIPGYKNIQNELKLLLLFLLWFSPSVSAVDVTFRVEMTNHINKGLFNPSSGKVYLRGSFNNWGLGTEMQKQQGSNIYSVTLSLNQNTSYEYKYFINTPGAENNGWESDSVGVERQGNRVAFTRTVNAELAVMYFDNSNMPCRKSTEHFLFYCDPQDENVLNDLAARLEKDFNRIVPALEAYIGSKIQFEIFKDIQTHHTATGDISGADWGVGSAFGKKLVKMLSPNKPTEGYTYDALISTAAHEFTHCVVAWKMTVPVKSWLNEGCAMYFADNPFVRNKSGVIYAINHLGFKPTLTYIENNFGDNGYEFSTTVADFIVTKYGTHALASFVGNAVFPTLGFATQEDFEKQWHLFIDQYYLNTPGTPVSREKAEVIAVNWYRHWNPSRPEDCNVSEYFPYNYDDKIAFHVFNFRSGGWVVVPAGERMAPVTGYNFSSKANASFFLWWVYHTHLEDVPTPETVQQWTDIYNNDFSRFSSEQVLPLLTTSWHQWWPYNAYYPKDPVFFPEENGFYRSGCLPIAAVQAAKFWNYPDKGRGKINVNDAAWGTFTRDFSKVVFDWKNMPDFMPIDKNMPEQQYSPSAALVSNMALATINFGASLLDYASAFSTYWKYSSNADVIEKRSFTDDEWLKLCKSDLDNGRPLMTTGSSDVEGQGGHAFVVDGYQAGSYFHSNFGWSDLNGYMNGYFQLNNLGGHLHNNNVLLNLQPEKNNPQLGGPYTADSNTVLLMHFNGSLKDDISSANASMHGSGISFAPSDSLGLGQCLRIDNSASWRQAYLTVPYNQKMNLSGDWTIEAWVYISSWKAPHTMYPYIASKPGSIAWWDANYSLKLNAAEGAPLPEYGFSSVNNDAEQFYGTKGTMEPGRWYHLAFVRKTASRNIKLLVHDTNKQLIFCRTQPYINADARKPRINFNDLFIGWLGMDYNTYFDGFIDELRISNTARDFETGSQQVNVCVWPGDADNDGKVKLSDVLPLGFFYGKTGPSRILSEQGSAWKAMTAAPWDIYKSAFADCNGDGLVDVKDLLSIGYNYNKVTPSSGNLPSARAGYISAQAAQNSPKLSIRFISKGQIFSDLKMLKEGDEFYLSVLMTNARDLLGISFDLKWDKDLFNVISAEEDLRPGDIWQKDALAVNKLINEEGRYEAGITNTSGNPVKTEGEVLQLKMKLKKEAVQAGFDIIGAEWMDIRGNKFIIPSDGKLTGISDALVKIKDYELLSYPNPFNPSANIRFSLPLAGKVYLKIFNALGREVASLINGGQYESGEYTLQWNASAFPSGLYICRFNAGSKVISRKILLVK